MKLNFGQEVLVLPASVLSHLDAATPEQLRVLLWLASDLSLAAKHKQLAKLAGCDATAARAAVDFWCACGLLGDGGECAVPAMATVPTAMRISAVKGVTASKHIGSMESAHRPNAAAVTRFSLPRMRQKRGKLV